MFLVNAWNWLLDAASSWNLLAITIRLLFALIVGLIIGIDRERKRRVAGIKTHILVCLGSALVMITSQYISGVSGESELGILVDAMGRVNYGAELNDRKGISKVMLANQTLMDYDVYTIPLDNLENLSFKKADSVDKKTEPVFLKGAFKAGKGDCFVNMKGFTKGYVFVNGFNLGRYWDIGPQRALYLPGTLLKENNEIIIFEMEGYKNAEVTIQDKPDLG